MTRIEQLKASLATVRAQSLQASRAGNARKAGELSVKAASINQEITCALSDAYAESRSIKARKALSCDE